MKRTTLLVLAFTLLAFLLRAYHLDFQSLWRDEVDAIRFARSPWPELIATFTGPGWNGPLYFFVLRYWLALAGSSEFSLRYFSLFFGVLTVPLSYILGRRWLGQRSPGDVPPTSPDLSPQHRPSAFVGVWTALLMAVSPYLVWYSQEGKMYALVLALGILSMYLYRRALDEGRWWWWAGHVLVTSLGLYTHILMALLIPTQALLFILGWPRYRAHWRGWLVDMLCLTLPYLPLATWQMPLLLSGFQTGHPFYPLGDMVSILFSAYAQGILSPLYPLSHVVMAFLCLAGILALVKVENDLSRAMGNQGPPPSTHQEQAQADNRRRLEELLVYLTVPVLAVYLVSLRMPVFTDRYLIWVAPAFYLLAARGLAAIRARSGLVFALVLALALTGNLVTWWTQVHTPIKSDFRAAARYFAAHRQGDELVIFQIPYVRYTFEYYFHDEYRWAEGLYTNYGMSEEEVDRLMQAMVAGYEEVWLVASEMEMWDQRGLVKRWLDTHGQVMDRADFTRVTLVHYKIR